MKDSAQSPKDSPKESPKDSLRDSMKDTMKKVVLTGVGTLFLTEETIRNMLGEFKLPKELWGGLLENASKTKQEFLTAFAKEVAGVISQIDVAGEARKFFEDNKVKVTVEMSFEKNKKKKANSSPSDDSIED